MGWNSEDLQTTFHQRVKRIEIDIDGLKVKMKDNDNYERFHDEKLGELYLYLLIENTINLTSKSSFLNYLDELRKEGPGNIKEALVQSTANKGWNNEIKSLVKEYG